MLAVELCGEGHFKKVISHTFKKDSFFAIAVGHLHKHEVVVPDRGPPHPHTVNATAPPPPPPPSPHPPLLPPQPFATTISTAAVTPAAASSAANPAKDGPPTPLGEGSPRTSLEEELENQVVPSVLFKIRFVLFLACFCVSRK